MYIHNLDPIAFEIFTLKIYWYSLAYLVGFIFSIYFSRYLINNRFINLEFQIVDNFFSWAIVGVILGGRIGYVIFYNLDYYILNLFEIFKIWKGGMSFHGGLIGLVVCMIIFSKKNNIKFIELSNLAACCAPVGIFLGRLANFVNGELKGKPTNSNWGVKYDSNDVLRHPSQLYESFFEGIVIFVVLLFFLKTKTYQKINLCAIFLIFYGIFRFSIEFFREPDNHLGLIYFNFSMGQLLSVPLVLLGVLLLRYEKRNN